MRLVEPCSTLFKTFVDRVDRVAGMPPVQAILKKSCLGVLLCDRRCQIDDGQDIVRVRPSICDKARRKQISKSTSSCRLRARCDFVTTVHCSRPLHDHCMQPQ